MKILVTGTPGSGKTSNARKIAEGLGLPYANVTTIINMNPQVVEKIENKVRVIKPNLKKVLEHKLPESYVIDTHLIEYSPKTDIIVILRCEPNELYKRLKKRNYSKDKIKENIEVELLDYFTQKTGKKKEVIEVDTSKKSSDENVKLIIKMIKNKKWNKGSISWDKKKYMKLVS